MIRGRWFDDRGTDEIVINHSLAVRLWPTGDPLGARVSFISWSPSAGEFNHPAQVVGIVRDTPYIALRQGDAFMLQRGSTGTILVRTAGPAASVQRAATTAVARVDPRLVVSARPLAEDVAGELAEGRQMILVASSVGLLALLVALAGVGVTAAQSVAQRTHEIGIRMALGARRRDAVAFIVRRVLEPVAIGLITALAIASQATRMLESLLYGLSPLDPIAFGGRVVFVMSAAGVAAWLPARRAATIDPVVTLRSE